MVFKIINGVALRGKTNLLDLPLLRPPSAAQRGGATGRRLDPEVSGMPQKNEAGEGNRTLVVGLGSRCSTIELHPRSDPVTMMSV